MAKGSITGFTQTHNEEQPGMISIILGSYSILIGCHKATRWFPHLVIATVHLTTVDSETKGHFCECNDSFQTSHKYT